MTSKKKKTIPLNAAECINAVSKLIEADPQQLIVEVSRDYGGQFYA